MSMNFKIPPYFDSLIRGFQRGAMSRYVHLGYWDRPDASEPGRLTSPEEFVRAQARLNEILLSLTDLRHQQHILDVGCGFGGSLQQINQDYHHMDLTGVNIDPRQLAICRQLIPRHSNRFHWIQADACILPFRADSVDRILCIEAMFHFASRRKCFLEAARILRPGGVLILSDMILTNSAKQLNFPGVCLEALLQDGYGPWHDFWSDDADHVKLGEAAGLHCIDYIDITTNTSPSYHFTVPSEINERHDPGDTIIRAGIVLRWLHHQGHLRYLIAKFRKH
jgi:MPBQ/MSBQ methyltransferase